MKKGSALRCCKQIGYSFAYMTIAQHVGIQAGYTVHKILDLRSRQAF